jgi:hypothetical protein
MYPEFQHTEMIVDIRRATWPIKFCPNTFCPTEPNKSDKPQSDKFLSVKLYSDK